MDWAAAEGIAHNMACRRRCWHSPFGARAPGADGRLERGVRDEGVRAGVGGVLGEERPGAGRHRGRRRAEEERPGAAGFVLPTGERRDTGEMGKTRHS
jgi:hypothetical protein